MPYRKRTTVTPLSVAKASGNGSFDRLAPLPAPKFRAMQAKGGAEGLLGVGQLSIGQDGTEAVVLGDAREGEEEEAVGVSPGGHITKRRAKSRPVSLELIESANGLTQRLANASTPADAPSLVAFPTAGAHSPTSPLSPMASPRPRQRTTYASNVSASSRRSRAESTNTNSSVLRSRTQSISQRARPLSRRVESSGSATLFFGPPIPRSSTPVRSRQSLMLNSPPTSMLRPQGLLGRPQMATRHSYAGPMSGDSWASPVQDSSPLSMPRGTDDEVFPMGEISDEDADSDFAPMPVDVLSMDEDEEDLFFGSSSFNQSFRQPDEGLGAEMDADDSFGWGAPPNTSYSMSLIESTPSPRSKMLGGIAKLEKKYKPRDSGVVLSEDDDSGIGLGPSLFGAKPPVNMGRGLGRSGSVLDAMPRASTSVSTLGSDPELVTPLLGPSSSSGWPGFPTSLSSSDSLSDNDVDAFIIKTLMHAQSAAEGQRRPPGTPHKRVKVAFVGPRPWQSAVASKVGFDFGEEEAKDGKGKAPKKKAPRKSLPAAFPMLGRKGTTKAEDRDGDTDEEASPSDRKNKTEYQSIGLGRPSVGRASWLLRRSSSGAISVASGSGSGESYPATPTASRGTLGWQLPPPRIPSHLSPLKTSIPSHLSPNRTASGSSSASITPVSPTASRQLQISGPHALQPLKPAAAGSAFKQVRPRPSLSVLVPSEDTRPGKFEREFVEIGEVGSGEFGKVMKVRRKDREDVAAVKKSKRFEGVRHRLRLREEVEVLQHLSARAGPARHPNVLAYVDSWEQDEALYIQTEMCELGNFAHFLWEYGRAFPVLDEARVWKILADLSNGLHFIHDAGVIHLDLKPANVFITGEGRFKIGDFGMASLWPRAALAPDGFEREGDKVYLAPEVLQGRYGKAADMFSLGITMLETASNIVVPDQGAPWHRLRQDDLSQVEMPDDTSPELVRLIRAMMRADPAARVDARGVWADPVVARARRAMERMRGGGAFAASPLARAGDGFLEEILARDAMDEGA
ncbi:kinase-like protein [Auriscalpium vulgare]|uniref:Kinase-like protein n=1 Tax=Auriscalpium vulgare TaxID=40419 RepID=A0ACB8RQB7_9AGAM|nr:kinase-like protein [Auriscalpium vulgare]